MFDGTKVSRDEGYARVKTLVPITVKTFPNNNTSTTPVSMDTSSYLISGGGVVDLRGLDR